MTQSNYPDWVYQYNEFYLDDVLKYLERLQTDPRHSEHEHSLINAALVYTKWKYLQESPPGSFNLVWEVGGALD
jgi:hypothetical protein